MLTRLLELGILERFRLIQRPAVSVVARVERLPFNKGSQSQAFTRHEQQSRGELGNRSRCAAAIGDMQEARYHSSGYYSSPLEDHDHGKR